MNSSTPDGPDEVWALLQQFVDANSVRTQLRERLGRALGTGRGKIKALLLLEEQPRQLCEIADALQIDRPYATVLVNQLEDMGLTERSIDAADRRRKLVALTPAGLEIVTEARDVIGTPPASLSRLTRDELAQLGMLLSRLVAEE